MISQIKVFSRSGLQMLIDNQFKDLVSQFHHIFIISIIDKSHLRLIEHPDNAYLLTLVFEDQEAESDEDVILASKCGQTLFNNSHVKRLAEAYLKKVGHHHQVEAQIVA